MDTLLGAPAHAMYEYLERHYNDGAHHVLHYVTSRELYNIVKAAEAGHKGDPSRFRDYELPPPPGLANVPWRKPSHDLPEARVSTSRADIEG